MREPAAPKAEGYPENGKTRTAMNGGGKGSGGWLKLHYDKIITVIMLAGLAGSLVYLAVRIGMIRRMQEQHTQRISRYEPAHPTAAPVDSTPYEDALSELENPHQLPGWSNAVFVPESRVWCVDCRMPILYDAMKCSFCPAEQPPVRERDPLWDGDGDGIPNLWERKFGLDPTDPTDVHKDNDGDGFSNLIEFEADPQTDMKDLNKKHGTDLNDPEDYPPPLQLLVVSKISGDPFHLLFKATIKLSDGGLKFQVNIGANRSTVFAKLGDTIEGFVLLDYKEVLVRKKKAGITKVWDESVLSLKRGDKVIPLVKGEAVPYTEYTAELTFTLDDTVYPVKPNSEFDLKGERFRVNRIDSKTKTVVIMRLQDDKAFTVGRAPQ